MQPCHCPGADRIRVAFLLGNDTNVIDTAGPWEVFQDVMVMKEGAHTESIRADHGRALRAIRSP